MVYLFARRLRSIIVTRIVVLVVVVVAIHCKDGGDGGGVNAARVAVAVVKASPSLKSSTFKPKVTSATSVG